VAERLRAAVAAIAGLPGQVTVSIGLACCHQDETYEKLVERADVALYAAKQAGRNRLLRAEDGAESFLRTTARRAKHAPGSESAMYRAMTGEKPPPGDGDSRS
jgi:predicted signal transduction protein with EAL and GGDEF domain